jgi:hypothetical protein
MKTMKFFILMALVAICASRPLAQSPFRNPVSLKTDMVGFRTLAPNIECEVLLSSRISGVAQIGLILHGNQVRGGYGAMGKVGAKYYLKAQGDGRLHGFALRPELYARNWRGTWAGIPVRRHRERAALLNLGYTVQPFKGLLVEPLAGIGRARIGYDMDSPDPDQPRFNLYAPAAPWVAFPGRPMRCGNDTQVNEARWVATFGVCVGWQF